VLRASLLARFSGSDTDSIGRGVLCLLCPIGRTLLRNTLGNPESPPSLAMCFLPVQELSGVSFFFPFVKSGLNEVNRSRPWRRTLSPSQSLPSSFRVLAVHLSSPLLSVSLRADSHTSSSLFPRPLTFYFSFLLVWGFESVVV